MILRLPEKRDYFPDMEGNPVGKYFETKSANDRFFKQKSQEKINLNQFNGHTNYMTAHKNSVGVP